MRLGARLLMLVALTGVAGGCVGLDPNPSDDLDLVAVDIEAARAMAPDGPPFAIALKDGYFKLSDYDAAAGDPADSIHFARKAVASAKAFNVQPDAVSFRSLAGDTATELEAARSRLMAALEANGRTTLAAEAARAQVAFDCWLEAVEANDQPRIDLCRATFEDAIGKVEAALQPGIEDVYLVFFAWDRADLTPTAEQVLDGVAKAALEGRPQRVLVDGHADRSGPESYNLALSQRRAEVVAAALRARGVPGDAMSLQAFGETRPRVPTADGVREPQNRRVEILFR